MHASSAVAPPGIAFARIDEAFVVADKPAGLPAVPGRPAELHDCVAGRVQLGYPDARVVHRLDQATSGLMLFARGAVAQRALARAFEQRQVAKEYVALVAGLVADDEGVIALPIGFRWAERPLRCIDRAQGKSACTRWRVLAREPGSATTRLALEPLTGRTHQIRVHLAAIGHPVVGDALYAPPPGAPAPAPRLLLHARSLGFAHPVDGSAVLVTSPVPF